MRSKMPDSYLWAPRQAIMFCPQKGFWEKPTECLILTHTCSTSSWKGVKVSVTWAAWVCWQIDVGQAINGLAVNLHGDLCEGSAGYKLCSFCDECKNRSATHDQQLFPHCVRFLDHKFCPVNAARVCSYIGQLDVLACASGVDPSKGSFLLDVFAIDGDSAPYFHRIIILLLCRRKSKQAKNNKT